MNLQEAGDAPRMLHEGSSQPTGEQMNDGGLLNIESGIDEQVVVELQKRGHQIGSSTGGYGGYQAIRRDEENGTYIGASESRKDGHAAGY
jgi:gamma-glutamyltranspeptidase/glutathione hydrolase